MHSLSVEERRTLDRVLRELENGMQTFRQAAPFITIYGSARIPEGDPAYEMGMEVAAELVKLGFAVMTGGGPSIMEAGNRGAQQAGGISAGCHIHLEREQQANQYLDLRADFHDLFTRKFILRNFSAGFVALPGGFGTLDELFEILTLIQTGEIKGPLVLMGKDFWEPLLEFMRSKLCEQYKTISAEDLKLFYVTDNPKEAAQYIAAQVRGVNPNTPKGVL